MHTHFTILQAQEDMPQLSIDYCYSKPLRATAPSFKRTQHVDGVVLTQLYKMCYFTQTECKTLPSVCGVHTTARCFTPIWCHLHTYLV